MSSVGPNYWRSIEEYADAPEFRAWLDHEFPVLAGKLQEAEYRDPVNRRHFLRLMTASLALTSAAVLPGCRRPVAKVLPYNQKPEDIIPGKPLYYATTMVLAGVPTGLLVETHAGRPTKIEGNPKHPLSLGATNTWAQAAVLELYDPDRSAFVVHDGKPATWEDFLSMLDREVESLQARQGQGLAILGEVDRSPTKKMLRQRLLASLPAATWHVDPLSDALRQQPQLKLENAEVILSLDADLLNVEDSGVAYRKAFAECRARTKPKETMNRLYVVEPCPTVTGSSADHRLRLPLSQVYSYVLSLARALGLTDLSAAGEASWDPRWIEAVAADLKLHAGRSVVAAGHRLPLHVHEVVRRINDQLNNTGKTVFPAPRREDERSFADLVDRLSAGDVNTLVLLGTNPNAFATADVPFAEFVSSVPTRIHLGTYRDEAAELCNWHVPEAHFLESWGDARFGETLSAVQPMIEPLLGGKSALELVARLAGHDTTDPYGLVRESLATIFGDVDIEQRFRQFLHDGVATLPDKTPAESKSSREELPGIAPNTTPSNGSVEIAFALDASVFDGRFANNGWLQECPDPLTKLTWDNAALIAPATAESLGVETGNVVRIDLKGRSIEIPAFILPGCADAVVTLPLGYGRQQAGVLAAHAGVDVRPLRTAEAMHWGSGAKVTKTGAQVRLATTQEHWAIRDEEMVAGQLKKRGILREVSSAQLAEDPHIVRHMDMHVPTTKSIYELPVFEDRQQWAMTIDLNRCTGCNACVVACQSENNVPIVGRDEVLRGREMQWMRIDRYFSGLDPAGDVTISGQPMMCQHCEIAPCEQVCPVNATVHDEEGLNLMVYNRCLGTRYCSNNCPYKVRRFNFFDYNKGTLRESEDAQFNRDSEPDPLHGFSEPQAFQPAMAELEKMQKNPDVTVRMRGVMEKCTFCIQRIQQAKVDQKVAAGQTTASTNVPDGTIRTACQQVCPSDAIVFGDNRDPQAAVARLLKDRRAYRVIDHVGTRPRVSYLARVRNINPDMPEAFVATAVVHHDEGHGPDYDHAEVGGTIDHEDQQHKEHER